MPRKRALRRPLPEGLFICPECDQPRGKTPSGSLSVCLCQGLRCNWCGHVGRRPITDYYGRDGQWWHVPWFASMIHRCEAPPEARIGPQTTALPADDDTHAYNDTLDQLVWDEVAERDRQRADYGEA
jgi:hypothetical protein